MKYKLNVQKFIENPEYDKELDTWNERNRYSQRFDDVKPSRIISSSSLDVELTEEEYQKLKEEVIKIFK